MRPHELLDQIHVGPLVQGVLQSTPPLMCCIWTRGPNTEEEKMVGQVLKSPLGGPVLVRLDQTWGCPMTRHVTLGTWQDIFHNDGFCHDHCCHWCNSFSSTTLKLWRLFCHPPQFHKIHADLWPWQSTSALVAASAQYLACVVNDQCQERSGQRLLGRATPGRTVTCRYVVKTDRDWQAHKGSTLKVAMMINGGLGGKKLPLFCFYAVKKGSSEVMQPWSGDSGFNWWRKKWLKQNRLHRLTKVPFQLLMSLILFCVGIRALHCQPFLSEAPKVMTLLVVLNRLQGATSLDALTK